MPLVATPLSYQANAYWFDKVDNDKVAVPLSYHALSYHANNISRFETTSFVFWRSFGYQGGCSMKNVNKCKLPLKLIKLCSNMVWQGVGAGLGALVTMGVPAWGP